MSHPGDPGWVSTSREPRPWLRPVLLIVVLLVAAAIVTAVLLLRSHPDSATAASYTEAYSAVNDAEDRLLPSIDADRRKGDRAALVGDLGALANAFQAFHDRMAGLDFGGHGDEAGAVIRDAAALAADLRALAADPAHTNANKIDADLATWDQDTGTLADVLGVSLPTPAPPAPPLGASP